MPKSFIINKSIIRSVMITLLVLISGLELHSQSGTIGSGNSPAINGQGRPLGGINVAVCVHPATGGYPCNNPATIYTDATFSVVCTSTCSTPTTTDSQGNWGFWVLPGQWDVEFYGVGITSKTVTLTSFCNLSALCTTVASVNVLAQSQDISATTLYVVPSNAVGLYRVSAYAVVTTAAGTTSSLPAMRITWTDADTSVSESPAVNVTNGNSANMLGTTSLATTFAGSIMINVKAGTTIQYLTNGYASNPANAMQFALHIRVEFLGP